MKKTKSNSYLLMKNIRKEFGDVVANDEITLSVDLGEIHGLLGENGAGKSTLMKILHGKYQPDGGGIYIDNKEVRLNSPEDAIDCGIGMVHQHFRLVPRLSVLDNIILGQKSGDISTDNSVTEKIANQIKINREAAEKEVLDLIDKYDLEIDINKKVYELDLRERQIVEILKSLYKDVRILILDEPTAVLPPHQLDELLETVRKIASENVAIIFITHKIEEVTTVADRATVLRDGRIVNTVNVENFSHAQLAQLMVGEEVMLDIHKPEIKSGKTVLTGSAIHTTDERGVRSLHDVDISLDSGEIVGVAGVGGNGPNDLLKCLAGAKKINKGKILVNGTDLTNKSIQAYINNAISYIPEDRIKFGCAPEETVEDNMVMKEIEQFQTNGLINDEQIQDYADQVINKFDVKLSNKNTKMKNLSGGNMQKAIIGRELYREPDIIIANKPTRGVDVGAIEFIRNKLIEACKSGTSVIFHSEDLDEIFQLSDRIIVMHDGKIIYKTNSGEAERKNISQLMIDGN